MSIWKSPNKLQNKEFIKSNKLISKTQQRFKSEKHNVFTENIKKIALSSSNYKRIQSINSMERCACETNKDLVCKKEYIKCNNLIKQYEKY